MVMNMLENTETLIQLDSCKNLYDLITAIGNGATEGKSDVLLWAPGVDSSILQSLDELEMVDRYARKFGAKLALSAANNQTLRNWAKQLGWKVYWEIPEMDSLLEREAIRAEADQWVYHNSEETSRAGD